MKNERGVSVKELINTAGDLALSQQRLATATGVETARNAREAVVTAVTIFNKATNVPGLREVVNLWTWPVRQWLWTNNKKQEKKAY